VSRPPDNRRFDGDSDFDARVLPTLLAQPFYRRPTADEIDRSYAAYLTGDPARLVDTWREVASPTRAELGPLFGGVFRATGLLPGRINGLAFLSTLRGVLAAGVRFRARLKTATQEALHTEFPWLERRHEHVPPGYIPAFEFPTTFDQFIDAGDLDDARARWQLAAALNEVQQTVLSDHFADLYRLPELRAHAAREHALALNYFSHWSPSVTQALWSQCLHHLDALNAAVFAMACGPEGAKLIARATFASTQEWRAFASALAVPQWTLPV
jgi:hypothetical protein